MGRQWLQKKREENAAKRGKVSTKLVREITVAAKHGNPDPAFNSRLALAIEAARKGSVSSDTIQRAIKKGAGLTGEKVDLELMTFEGFAPHQVPVIVECWSDNRNRTVPEIRVLFRDGQMGAKVGFLFHHVGLVEATHPQGGQDLESVAIEAGAQNVEPLEEVPDGASGGRFITDRGDVDVVTKALQKAGWTVTVAELGYVAKEYVELAPEQRNEVVAFLEALDDNDDVHRVYAALR
ncbi:MAG: YebC/PmpR family DNA-binding transcriptional regulator [Planctomycetes bacterium]|nr:YebC/PmpR family DNA-binding transcriptional regulator [Planctomycetota bacterium]